MRRRTLLIGVAAAAAAELVPMLIGASVIRRPSGKGAANPKRQKAVRNGGLMPEMYGAVGDGVTNDTDAFQDMAANINAASGGVIALRPGAVYLVGRQNLLNDGTWMFRGEEILTLDGLTRGVTIYCNGAKFKLAAGMRHGSFNADGTSDGATAPNFNNAKRSVLVPEGIVTIKSCTGPVKVFGPLELDGNDAEQIIGGEWGDTGRQLPANGLFMWGNTGGEYVEDIYAHHNLLDGVEISGSTNPGPNGTYKRVRSEYNARQGCSFIGGRGYSFEDCNFNYTTLGEIFSGPGAGFDAEAETSPIRDLSFKRCEFGHNGGVGMLGVGDTADLDFEECTFRGSYSYATWLVTVPRTHYKKCMFYGPKLDAGTAHLTTSGDAPIYEDCEFSDNPDELADDSTHTSYALLNIGAELAAGTHFQRCTFRFGRISQGLGNSGGGLFEDCNFIVADGWARNAFFGSPNLRGVTRVTDPENWSESTVPNANLYTGILGGPIYVNGVNQRAGSKSYDAPLLTDGSRATTTVSVPRARLGRDIPLVTFSNVFRGISTAASYVSADGTVTVVLENRTGQAVDLAIGTLRVAVTDLKAVGWRGSGRA